MNQQHFPGGMPPFLPPGMPPQARALISYPVQPGVVAPLGPNVAGLKDERNEEEQVSYSCTSGVCMCHVSIISIMFTCTSES